MSSAIILILVLAVILYVVLCPRLNYPLYRSLLFHPAKFANENESRAPQLAGIQGEDVSFRTKSGNLYGWMYRNPKADFTVMISHGNGGNVSSRIDTVTMLLNCGVSVMIYDYRGYGKSDGLPDIHGVCVDALAAYDFLHDTLKIPTDRIVLFGESLGCAVSTYVSSQRECGAMILQCGFASLNRIASELFPVLHLYPGRLLANPPLDSVSILKSQKNHPPLFIIHGHLDQTVPFAHAHAMLAAASEPKKFLELPNCGHCDLCQVALPEYTAEMIDFLNSVYSHHKLERALQSS